MYQCGGETIIRTSVVGRLLYVPVWWRDYYTYHGRQASAKLTGKNQRTRKTMVQSVIDHAMMNKPPPNWYANKSPWLSTCVCVCVCVCVRARVCVWLEAIQHKRHKTCILYIF